MKKIRLILLTLTLFLSYFSQSTEKNPPLIQLATSYTAKDNVNSFWISEKLDGVRGYWDGKSLYTRGGRKITTPRWFTHAWPNTHIDGELWTKRNDFSFIVSCVKTQNVDTHCWQKMKFMMFDLPANTGTFTERIQAMKSILTINKKAVNNMVKIHPISLQMINQFKVKDETELLEQLETMVTNEAEGLMLHHEDALYKIGRSSDLLKLKKHHDDEAIVLEHYLGKGKYQGKLGSLLVRNTEGKIFKIGTGFSDKERESPPEIGSVITYRYTGKTENGIPRFARFMRIRNE